MKAQHSIRFIRRIKLLLGCFESINLPLLPRRKAKEQQTRLRKPSILFMRTTFLKSTH